MAELPFRKSLKVQKEMNNEPLLLPKRPSCPYGAKYITNMLFVSLGKNLKRAGEGGNFHLNNLLLLLSLFFFKLRVLCVSC